MVIALILLTVIVSVAPLVDAVRLFWPIRRRSDDVMAVAEATSVARESWEEFCQRWEAEHFRAWEREMSEADQ